MGLTKLFEFRAEAEILGNIHNVSFSHTVLSIEGLDMMLAQEILNALATRTLKSVRFPGTPTGVGVEAPSAQEAREDPERTPVAAKPLKDGALDENEAARVAAEPGPVERERKKAKAEEPPKEAKAGKKAKPESVGTVAGVVTVRGKEMPAKLVMSTRLVEVIGWLAEEAGVDTEEDLVAECETLKGQVPMLDKISDVRERVLSAVGRQPDLASKFARA